MLESGPGLDSKLAACSQDACSCQRDQETVVFGRRRSACSLWVTGALWFSTLRQYACSIYVSSCSLSHSQYAFPALFDSMQHLVDLFGQFYGLMRHLLPRLLLLLRGFISRSHASLASVGVAAYARLVSSCGTQLAAEGWQEVGWLTADPQSCSRLTGMCLLQHHSLCFQLVCGFG